MMRFPSVALGPIGILLFACGGMTGVTAGSAGSTADAGTDPADTGATTTAQPLVGQVLVTTMATSQGQTLETFNLDLQPLPTTTPPCPGATTIVGACCSFPAVVPPPTQVGGGSGSPAPEESAGTVTLLDATTNASLATFLYSGGLYQGLPLNYATATWHPGDILNVSATGGAQMGAFSVSAPVLLPPVVQAPSNLVATHEYTVAWQPDPNAETMSITILDDDAGGVEVVCSVPDARGTVTVDASLFAAFKSGDLCQGTAARETIRYGQTALGAVALKTFGYAGFPVSVK